MIEQTHKDEQLVNENKTRMTIDLFSVTKISGDENQLYIEISEHTDLVFPASCETEIVWPYLYVWVPQL